MREVKRATVPVRANTYREAQDIFDKWYNKHKEDPKDSTIYDMLDEGSYGIEVGLHSEADEADYNPEDILLPEENSKPSEPKYDMFIIFADTGKIVSKVGIALADVATNIFNYSQKYYLFPDSPVCVSDGYEKQLMMERSKVNDNESFWIRAVPK